MYTDKNNGGRNAGVSLELDILSKPEVCVIAGELYACYQWSCMKAINLYPLEFDDSGGKKCLNLWYSLAQKLMKCPKILIIEGVLLGF